MTYDDSLLEEEAISTKYHVLILGAGNPLMKDDGIGPHIARELEKLKLPEGVKAVDAGVKGLALVDMMQEASKVMFVDAVEMGMKAGSVRVFTPKDIRIDAEKTGFSSHEIGLPQLLFLASLLGLSTEVAIVGIQPKDLGWGTGLSPELQRAVPHILESVLDALEGRGLWTCLCERGCSALLSV